jgi:hypothetical protein
MASIQNSHFDKSKIELQEELTQIEKRNKQLAADLSLILQHGDGRQQIDELRSNSAKIQNIKSQLSKRQLPPCDEYLDEHEQIFHTRQQPQKPSVEMASNIEKTNEKAFKQSESNIEMDDGDDLLQNNVKTTASVLTSTTIIDDAFSTNTRSQTSQSIRDLSPVPIFDSNSNSTRNLTSSSNDSKTNLSSRNSSKPKSFQYVDPLFSKSPQQSQQQPKPQPTSKLQYVDPRMSKTLPITLPCLSRNSLN